MKVLVTSGTGKVAQELIKLLKVKGAEPIVMSHTKSHLQQLSSGVKGVFGDFNDPSTWEAAFEGVDKLCLITPPMQEEAVRACAFASKAYEKGIKHITFLGVHDAENAPQIPHIGAKILIKKSLMLSGKAFTIIEPNNFYQNDFWFLETAKTKGEYLQPIGQIGLNRVDLRDIAEAMANATTEERHQFKIYPLIGPESLTGDKTARILSEVYEKEIIYPQDCLQKWEQFVKPMIPDWLLADWKQMYSFFISKGLRASPVQLIQQEKILNRPPRKYEDFIKENV